MVDKKAATGKVLEVEFSNNQRARHDTLFVAVRNQMQHNLIYCAACGTNQSLSKE